MGERKNFISTKHVVLTDDDYVEIGSRHSSDDVAKEADVAVKHWEEDMDVMKMYGFGPATLDVFKKMLSLHEKVRTERPEAIAAKATAVKERNEVCEKGWVFVGRMESALSLLALDDKKMADELNKRIPKNTAGLAPGIRTLAKLLEDNKE